MFNIDGHLTTTTKKVYNIKINNKNTTLSEQFQNAKEKIVERGTNVTSNPR